MLFISDSVWIKVSHIVPYLAHAIEVLTENRPINRQSQPFPAIRIL